MPKITDSIGYIEDTLQVNKDSLVFKDSTGQVLDKAALVATLNDSNEDSLPKAIVVEIEATHSGITKNNTEYVGDKMDKSAASWTSPYEKPVLKEHNPDGPTLGRVKEYQFKKSELNPDKDTIKLTLEITDKDSIRRHMDGTALTYSIGGQAKELFCGICGVDLISSDSYCGHWKGYTYEKEVDGKKVKEKCIWKIGLVDYLEVSEVNIPADEWAQKLNVTAKEEDSLESTPEESAPAPTADAATGNIADGLSAADSILANVPAEGAPATPETPPAGTTADSTPPPSTETPPAGDPPPAKTADVYEAELQALRDKLKTAEDSLLATQTELQTTKDTLATTTTTLTTAQADLKVAQDKVVEVSNSSQQTFKASVEVAKQLKKAFADSIAESKIRTGDLTEDKKEETIATLVVKSAKELSDTLDGLKVAEKARHTPPRVTQGNVGEGALSVHQDRVDVNETKKSVNDSKPFTADDAIDAIINAKGQ